MYLHCVIPMESGAPINRQRQDGTISNDRRPWDCRITGTPGRHLTKLQYFDYWYLIKYRCIVSYGFFELLDHSICVGEGCPELVIANIGIFVCFRTDFDSSFDAADSSRFLVDFLNGASHSLAGSWFVLFWITQSDDLVQVRFLRFIVGFVLFWGPILSD